MSQPHAEHLPSEVQVQRASEAERLRFSPSSEFRIVCAGGPGLPDFYEERSARGDGPPLHRHPWPSWELVLEGTVRVVVAERQFELHAGDSLYVPPDAPHAYVVQSESARVVGINLSDGRFPNLQRQASPLMTRPEGLDMGQLVALAGSHAVEVLGPPLAAPPAE